MNEFIIAIASWLIVGLFDKYFLKSENMKKLWDLFVKLKLLFRNKNTRIKPIKKNTHILKVRKKDNETRYSWQLLEVLTYRILIDNWEWKDTITETISYVLQLLYFKYYKNYDWINIDINPTIEWIYNFFEVTMEKIEN
jgi:hypothetical protein